MFPRKRVAQSTVPAIRFPDAVHRQFLDCTVGFSLSLHLFCAPLNIP